MGTRISFRREFECISDGETLSWKHWGGKSHLIIDKNFFFRNIQDTIPENNYDQQRTGLFLPRLEARSRSQLIKTEDVRHRFRGKFYFFNFPFVRHQNFFNLSSQRGERISASTEFYRKHNKAGKPGEGLHVTSHLRLEIDQVKINFIKPLDGSFEVK